MKQIYLPETDIYLNLYKEYENTYEFENVLSEIEFKRYRQFVIKSAACEKQYFSCQINGEPYFLRFGLVRHSRSPEGYVVRGALVGENYDLHYKRTRYEDDFTANINNKVIKTKIINDRLMNLLIDKELISKEEAESIMKVTREEINTVKFDYSTF
jgi:hypothetical protein